jgi:hypothetical protein
MWRSAKFILAATVCFKLSYFSGDLVDIAGDGRNPKLSGSQTANSNPGRRELMSALTRFSLTPIGLTGLTLVLTCSLALKAAAPEGWYVGGSKPSAYESGLDARAAYNHHPSAYLKSTKPVVDGFGMLMQDFRADHYAGKRVRFSAFVKTERVQDWAGLWLRVEEFSESLALDNMENRPIKGTTAWKNYEVVLDVPQDATDVFFGTLLSGSGTVWINSVKFETVGSNVPTTDKVPRPRDEPTNLTFEQAVERSK